MKNNFCRVKDNRHYLEPDSHIRDKVEVVKILTIYATKKELNMKRVLQRATVTCNMIHLVQLVKHFVALKAQVGKLKIAKFVNVPTILNNLKAKVNDLDVGKLKTAPADLKD